MRVTSSLWVAALIKRASASGAFATVICKGAEEAGAIYVLTNDLAGQFCLYCPAPQMQYGEVDAPGRLFECRAHGETQHNVDALIVREKSFDPDIWVVEVEDRQARSFIDPDEIVSP